MDHVLRALRAHHHRGGDLGRYRRRRRRSVPRPRPGRRGGAVPAWPHLRGAAADDDRRDRFERACAGDRGHLRRLSGAGEGDVQSSCLPRPRAAVRRQFDQLGAHRGADRLLFYRGGGAREPAPENCLHGADGKFRRRLCRLCRAAHGIAGRSAGGGDQRQRHPRPHLRHRRLRNRGRWRPFALVDIQVVNFERLLPESNGRDAAAVRAAMASAQSRRSRSPRTPQADARVVHRRSRRRAGMRRHHARLDARGRLLRRSAHRGGAGGGREGNARPVGADGGRRPRILLP